MIVVPTMLATLLLVVAVAAIIFAAMQRIRVLSLRRKLTDSYHKRAETTRFLEIFARDINSANELENWMNVTARYVAEVVEAQSVCIFSENGGYLQASGVFGLFPQLSSTHRNDYVLTKPKYIMENLKREKIKIGSGFIGEIALHKESVFVQQPEDDPRVAEMTGSAVSIKTLMAVPLIREGKVSGVICAVNNKNLDEPFTPEQFNHFKFFASQVVLAQSIIGVYSNLSQQQRISQELEFARNLQLSLMPKEFPQWGCFEIHAFTRAAKEVSGDFYDFVQIDNDRLLVVIGDACGKGIPACMIMAMTRSFIRSGIDRFTTLRDLMKELNDNIYRDTVDERYITLGCCLLNKKNSTMEYARAGHTPLLMFLRNHIREINPDGAGLGILPSELAEFDTLKTEISHDTTMLMFTDGINETTNLKDEFFGIPRVTEVYRDYCLAKRPPEEIIRGIMDSTENYSEMKKEQDDDQTIVIIRYN